MSAAVSEISPRTRRLRRADKTRTKIATIDIETAPNLAYTWGLFDQNPGINMLIEPGKMLCFASRDYATGTTEFYSVHHDGRESMLKNLFRIINSAEAIITYNGKSFDIKRIHAEFFESGLPMPEPPVHIDLLRDIRKLQKHQSHKLDFIAQQLGIGAKIAHEGFELWRKCLDGDERAWARMEKYNRGDVKLTERLYDWMLGWMPGHPPLQSATTEPGVSSCAQCAGTRFTSAGDHVTSAGTVYPRFRCRRCGGLSRGRHMISRLETLKGVAA